MPDTDDVDVGSALIESLRDPSAEVRRAAAKALGARHETRAARALAEAGLSWRDPRYRHARAAAVEALFHLSGPETARAVVGTVIERGATPSVHATFFLESLPAAEVIPHRAQPRPPS